jgi:hypothetical protein
MEGELDMRKKLTLVFLSIAAMLMLFTGPADASIVYTAYADVNQFLAATGIQGEPQKFSGNGPKEQSDSLEYFQNGYKYTVSTTSACPGDEPYSGLYWVQDGLSINNNADVLQISFTGAMPQAVGGYFWPTDFGGNNLGGTIIIVLSDGTEHEVTNAIWDTFTGIVTGGAVSITSIRIKTVDNGYYPTMNGLYVGSVATPIPGAVWLLGSGLLGLVALKRRIAG